MVIAHQLWTWEDLEADASCMGDADYTPSSEGESKMEMVRHCNLTLKRNLSPALYIGLSRQHSKS
jgi:hypothetical protein